MNEVDDMATHSEIIDGIKSQIGGIVTTAGFEWIHENMAYSTVDEFGLIHFSMSGTAKDRDGAIRFVIVYVLFDPAPNDGGAGRIMKYKVKSE